MLSDAVILTTQLDLPQIGVEEILGCTVKDDIAARALRRLQPQVARATIPETISPLLRGSKPPTGCP